MRAPTGIAMALAAAAAMLTSTASLAEQYDDGLSKSYYEKLKGKKVAWVPLSMGFDLTQAWYAAMKKQADDLGYEIITRDANWNSEVGAQALGALINEKPDILIFHNNDLNSYNRLIARAVDQGINVIQLALKAPNNGDAYVGTDWYRQYEQITQWAVDRCSTANGQNGKVAVVYGLPTSPGVQIGQQATNDTLAAAGDKITVVANQSGYWDASKSRDVTATILQQHPDLCAVVGSWDNADVGTAAAINEAGLRGKVALITSGGGEQRAACDNIANGNFTAYSVADTRDWARDLTNTISILLQTAPTPGANPFALYLKNELWFPEDLRPGLCWTLKDFE